MHARAWHVLLRVGAAVGRQIRLFRRLRLGEPDGPSRRLGNVDRTHVRLLHQPGRRRHRRLDDRIRAARARLLRGRDDSHGGRPRVPSRHSAPHQVAGRSARRRRLERQRDRRPDVSCRRRRRRRRLRSVSTVARSGSCAAFPTDSFAGSRIAVAQRGVPVADRPSAARARNRARCFCSALYAAVVRRRGERVDADVSRERPENLRRRSSCPRTSSLGYSLPFTVTLGAGWGHDGAPYRVRHRHDLRQVGALVLKHWL